MQFTVTSPLVSGLLAVYSHNVYACIQNVLKAGCVFVGLFLFLFVLFCFVLFCFVLFCFVLFCFVLFCFVLFVCLFVFNPFMDSSSFL